MYKEEILYAEERKEEIVSYVKEHKKCSVDELCGYFSVSPTTIRNDLNELSSRNLLTRTHGGAIYNNRTKFEPKRMDNAVKNKDVKKMIAQKAAEYIKEGDSVALDTGTTALEIAKCLTGRTGITVITNDIKIASYLEEHSPFVDTILIGGAVRYGFNCTVGPSAERFLKDYYVDKAFIGCNGFSLNSGVTTPSPEQAEIKRIMMDISSEKIVVCDETKLEHVAFVRVCDIAEVDMLITGGSASEEVLKSYRDSGLYIMNV